MTSRPPPPPKDHEEPLLDDERDSLDFELDDLDAHNPIFTDGTHKSTHLSKTDPKTILLITSALLLTVLGFTINTEASAYFEDVLGWKKPFATMYITHSSFILPWLGHLAIDRYQNRHVSYSTWVRTYNDQLRTSIRTIDAYSSFGSTVSHFKLRLVHTGPLEYLLTSMTLVMLVLTVSGCSWFFSLALTTPADLTAIYNCSTFFAAVFSVPILKERIGFVTMIAVALSIVGTFVITYGDTASHDKNSQIEASPSSSSPSSSSEQLGTSRLLGNLIACLGAIAFGLYEVLFKKFASSSRPMAPTATLPLTLAASALTGLVTLCTLWLPLLFMHFVGWETIEFPAWHVWPWIIVGVLSGAGSVTLMIVLVIWTDPVFGSMANVLSVFTVALADWVLFGLRPSLATYAGGAMITAAFAGLTWDTFRPSKH